MSTKADMAIAFHDKGYNCAQAVACSFCQEFGVAEEEMFRIAEGFGLGMGMMEVCGALSGMMMIIGLENSVGEPEKGRLTKGDTYRKVKEYVKKFQEWFLSLQGTERCGNRKSTSQLSGLYS